MPDKLRYDNRAPDGPIHGFFGLSYANYLVVPRAVLQSMPLEWQERFVACLRELGHTFDGVVDDEPIYDVRVLARAPEHHLPYVPCEDCSGTEETCRSCGGEGEVEDPEGYRYETPAEVGFRDDPWPHYNRGRTRILPPAEVEG